MSEPQFYGLAPAFSVTSALEAIADTLSAIKRRDQLTDGAIGDALNRSPDRVRDYRLAASDMGASTFLLAIRRWGEDFSPVLALAGYRLTRLRDASTCDHRKAAKISKALSELLNGLADGELTDDEVRAASQQIHAAGRAIDELRERVGRVA